MNKNFIIILVIILIVIIAGVYFLVMPKSAAAPAQQNTAQQQQQSVTAQGQQTSSNSNITNIQGMQIEILKQGSGEAAKSGDLVTVNYTGTLANGTTFDSSVDPKFNHVQPFQFTLGQNSVIQGWELGVVGMKIGEERKLTIPPELAYGSSGAGSVIPPNATLTFVIDLLKIN